MSDTGNNSSDGPSQGEDGASGDSDASDAQTETPDWVQMDTITKGDDSPKEHR